MYVIRQPTGFCSYYFTGFDRDGADGWMALISYAKTFQTADKARSVVAQINRRYERPPIVEMVVEYVTEANLQRKAPPSRPGPSLRLTLGRR